MKPAKIIPVPEGSAAVLFDTCAAEQILRVDSGINWPDGMEPCDVHVERGWPTRNGSFVVEWSFRLGSGSRCTLFGTQYDGANGTDHGDSQSAIVTAHGL